MDKRIVVGAKVEWDKGGMSNMKGEIFDVQPDDFTVRWNDKRTLNGYADADLKENGGSITIEEQVTNEADAVR